MSTLATPSTPTRTTTQESALQQGIAVGMRALGIDAVTADWPTLASAFRSAWRSWEQSTTLPDIRSDLLHSSLRPALLKSASRRGSLLASWTCDDQVVPAVRPDVAPQALPELLEIVTGVSFEAWIELTRSLVAELDEEQIVRAPLP